MTEQRGTLVVVGLCAEWCRVCREFEPAFDSLAEQFSDVAFHWFDIEYIEDCWPDELEVEDFPTVLIRRDARVVFFGPVPPQSAHLRRMIENFLDMDGTDIERQLAIHPEHEQWQLANPFCDTLHGPQ